MQRSVRLAPLLLIAVGVTGCGGSITDVTPRSAATTAAPALTPFCDAVEQSEVAAEPVSRWQAGQQVQDVDRVVEQVRTANQQVSALAPQELRGDVELVTGVVDRQLRLLQANGGDTLALARDAELERMTGDPAYSAAARRVTAYVRDTC